MKRRFSLLIVIVCAFAFSVLSACGSDDSSSFFDEDDTGLEGDFPGKSSGSDGEGDGKSSGGNSKNSSSSSAHDRLSSVEKIKPSVADSNGSIVDSRDSTVYGTLRQGPYIWMTRNMSKSVYGLYSVCYDADSKNCDKYGRLYVSGAGGVCPDKFRLPTRSEWKEGKKSLSLGLQYGGTCKKLDSLECSGLDSEAFYQVNDGSVFAIYGKETSLFRNSSDYNFYSVRCMAFTHIVHKKSDLPECDSTLRNLPNDFYVTSLDSGYTCGYSGWTIRYNSDRRKCLNVVDTALLYAMGDSTYVCRNNQWQMATLKDVGEICDSTCLDRVVEFNDTKYFCTDSGWSKLTYPSTELGLCKKSNYSRIDLTDKGEKFYCDSTGWTLLTYPENEIGLCVDSVRAKIALTNKGDKFYCDSTGWTLLTYPETEIGLCVDSIRAKIALTDKGDKFYCDSTGWALLKYPETEIGLCVDSIRTKTVLTSKGDKYYCNASKWLLMTYPTNELGFCVDSILSKIVVTSKKETFVCKSSGWSKATITDVAGTCDSTKYGKVVTFDSSQYACRMTNTWTALTDLELKIGLCTSDKQDSFAFDNAKQIIYRCDSLKWKSTSTSVYMKTFPCNEENRYDTLKVFNTKYKCVSSGWTTLLTFEYKIGICRESRLDEIATLDTNHYACKFGGTDYLWVQLKSWEYDFGVCPSNNTERITKQAPNGDYYYCNRGLWKWASLEYFIGTCRKNSSVVKDTVFSGVEYICDSSQVGNKNEWHRMTAADSAGGFCNRALVGKMMVFDDTVYACASINVFNDTAYTQEEMNANIFTAEKKWVIAPDSVAKIFRYNEIKNALGKCTSARLNETYKNDYLEIVCSSDGLWHGKTTTFTDSRDGKIYKQTVIGTQTWMAENLKYNPGADQTWCPNKEESKCNTHGRLYRWHSAMGLPARADSAIVLNKDSIQQGICPDGWRLPVPSDWETLAGYIMQKMPRLDTTYSGKYHPEAPFLLSTNDLFGFNNKQGGYVLFFYRNGIDPDVDMYPNAEKYWTALEYPYMDSSGLTSAYIIDMESRYYYYNIAYHKTYGLYVRCIKK